MTVQDLAQAVRNAVKSSGLTIRELSLRTGSADRTIAAWKIGSGLNNAADVLSLLEACGYEIRLRKMQHPAPRPLSLPSEAAHD